MYHRGRDGKNGLVTYVASNEYVVSGVTTIQSAVDYGTSGMTINVKAGSYAEQVTIDKSLTLDGGTSDCADVIIEGGSTRLFGVRVLANVQNVTLRDFKVQNTVGTNAGVWAATGNDGLDMENLCLENTAGLGAILAQGPVNGITINNCSVTGSGVNGRGIVIWDGFKENITITNCNVHDISGCCGIELQDGNASGVTMSNNTVTNTTDSGMSAIGLNGTTGANTISSNIITNCGRFGLEIKNPNGNGSDITVSNNTISISPSFSAIDPSEKRDIAGIAVFRRAVGPGNPDVPTGVTVTGNSVSGYVQDVAASMSEGFGIVIEGTNNSVSGNVLTGNDVGLQQQAGHLPYPGDGDQSDLPDTYFGRGNSPQTCLNTIGANTFSSNGIDTRNVGTGGGLVTNTTTSETFCSIQSAIDAANTTNGDIIEVSAGTYVENILVNKELEIYGAGIGNTIIMPAFSGPTPPSCPGSDCAGASNVIKLGANNIHLHDFTIQGNNPSLTSGVVVGGQDIDARNGIIGDGVAGRSNIEINNIEVDNIYLRGIYPQYTTGMNVHHNTVNNVQGSSGSIAIFSWVSAGNVHDNAVDLANDAISANHSKGIVFENNTVTNSLSGIHTDNNGDSGGVADIIRNNNVSSGGTDSYGIFVFAPYFNVLVEKNTVTDQNVGLASAGSYASGVITTFSQNVVDAQNRASSTGMYATTNIWGYTPGNNTVVFTNNVIKNTTDNAFYLETDATYTLDITANDNSITSNDNSVSQDNAGTLVQDFTCNWWGSSDPATIFATGLNGITFIPYLNDGTDDSGDPGFQPVPLSCVSPTDWYVNDNSTTGDVYTTATGDDTNPGTSNAPFATIQHAIDVAAATNTIYVDAGTYIEDVIVNKELDLRGANYGINPNTGVRVAESILMPATDDAENGVLVDLEASNSKINGFLLDGDNPGLNGGYPVGAADVNTSEGIQNAPIWSGPFAQIDHIDLQNNIFNNFDYQAIYLEVAFNSNHSWNYIKNNKFDNMWEGIQTYAMHTDISDNVFTTIDRAISIHGTNVDCDGGFVPRIANNEATIRWENPNLGSRNVGIWVNYRRGTAPALMVNNNILHYPTAPPSGKTFIGFYGLTLTDDRTVTFADNIIDGQGNCQRGFYLSNSPSTNVSLTGGTFTGITEHGVLAVNSDATWGAGNARLTIDGVHITMDAGATAGVEASGLAAYTPNIVDLDVSNTTITGGNAGVLISGTLASADLHNNPSTITGAVIGIDIDGSTASIYQNNITANGTGVRVINSGNLTSATENFITNNTVDGIRIESSAGTIGLINDNDLSGNTNYAINDLLVSPTVDATCNWYGSAVAGVVSGEVSGNVNFTPWLSLGNDSAPTDGFQPTPLSCDGTPVDISSAVASPSLCPNTGSILVTFSGGTAPYDIAWTSGSDTGISSPYTITGLAPGAYGITVTDVNGSTATSNATILSFPVKNETQNSYYATVQDAVNAAAAGDAITVCPGTYNENVNVTQEVTITGSGNGSDPLTNSVFTPTSSCSGAGFTVSADNVTIENMYVSNYQSGVVLNGVANPTINNMALVDYCVYGVNFAGANNTNVSITMTDIERTSTLAGTVGIRCGTATSVNGLLVDGCTITGNIQGWYTAQSGTPSAFDNITIQNSTISNNTQKGFYFEKLSNALLQNLTMDNNGTDVAYGFNNGIDINLKYDDYSNITIQNCDITNSGANGTATDPEDASAIAVKARDDSPSYDSNPATLTNVTIKNNHITGPMNGVRFGEFTKINNTPSAVTVQGNDLSFAFANKALISRINNDVNVVCNWHGSTNLATILATFTQAGSGDILLSTILDTGGDASGAVGFQPAGTCVCAGGNLVTNVNSAETFCTIQAAIDDPLTLDGSTITVDAGIYAEDIIVTKPLTILGPNAAINPCSGSRVAEAIVVPATAAISSGEIFHVAASNVTISGFTIDGDNTALTSGFTSTNGADIDAAEGITVYETMINNLTVTNNIIQNLSYFGVTLYDYPAGVPSSGHVISNNKFRDLGTYDAGSGIDYWGGGVLLYNNQYAAVTNNCMTNVRLGVQTGNFSAANPGLPASQMISNNTMSVRRLGIFHNLAYGTASTYTLDNNVITGIADIHESHWEGIELASMAVPSIATDNTVDGTGITNPSNGYEVWNVKNTSPAAISGGAVTNVSTGLFLNNYEGYNSNAGDGSHASVTGLSISPTALGTGIRVLDSPGSTSHAAVSLTINAGVTVTGGTKGLTVENTNASIATGDLNNLSFTSQSGSYIELVNNANDLDGTTVSFDGQTGATATLAQNFAIEDKIVHKIDNSALGFVLVKSGHDFVTVNSFVSPTTTTPSIQRAIDAASDGFIVNIGPGSYTNVAASVNKSLTFRGNNTGISGLAFRIAESYIDNSGYLSNVTFVIDPSKTVSFDGIQFAGRRFISMSAADAVTVENSVCNWLSSGPTQQHIDFGGAAITSLTFQDNDVTVNGPTQQAFQLFGTTLALAENTILIKGNRFYGGIPAPGDGVRPVILNLDYMQGEISENLFEQVDIGILVATGCGNLTIKQNDFHRLVRSASDHSGGSYAAGVVFYNPTNFTAPINILNNFFRLSDLGIRTCCGTPDFTGQPVNVNNNSFTGNIFFNIRNLGTGDAWDATCNWYGTTDPGTIAPTIVGPVNYIPWLIDGTDLGGDMTDGFQDSVACAAPCNLAVTSTSTTDATCPLQNNGTATVDGLTGGISPYSYLWSDGQITQTASNLIAGVYTVTVTDINGCTATASATVMNSTVYPVHNTSTSLDYCTIQEAIDDPLTINGNIIKVDAGTYAENIVLNKKLTLKGNNFGINPNTGSRIAESIIVPATSDPDPNSPTAVNIIYLTPAATGSTIDGFIFDGDNTSLTSAVVINGADIDAIECISGYDGTGDLTISNNILRNVTYAGIDFYNYYNSGGVTSNNYITNNKIDNIAQSPYGIGVVIYNNFYAAIENNVMTRVRVGVQTGNFYSANTGATNSISTNTIQSERRGIFHNLAYSNATAFDIQNNIITTVPGALNHLGISLSSLEGTVGANVSGNTIDGAYAGVDFWNCPSSNTITVNGGSITNCQYGVVASNYDGYNSNANSSTVAISGVSISGSTIAGVHVKDNPLNSNMATIRLIIDNDCEITGTGQLLTGILVTGPDASATIQNNDASIHGFAIGIDVDSSSATVTNNHIYDNGIGVRFINTGYGDVNTNNFDGGVDPDNGTDIQAAASAGLVNATPNNNLAGNTFGVENQSATSIDASYNYWESPSGPGPVGPGSGANVTTNVDYCPWLSDVPIAFGGTGTYVIRFKNISTGGEYCSLQDALADPLTVDGDTIEVAPGDYTEIGQIIIDKNITITGTGSGCGDVTFHPDMNTGSSGDARGWWLVNEGKTLNLNKVTLDGNGYLVYQAIRDHGNGTLDHVCFANILYQPSTAYAGTAVAAFGVTPGLSNVNITNSTFTNIGRVGVLYFGSELTSSLFDGNTYTGKGAGDWLDYALDIDAGANITVTNNTINGNTGVASSDNSTSAAILVTTYYGTGTHSLITDNDLTGNTAGIAVGFDGSDASSVEAHQNDFSNNPGGGVTNSNTSNIVDASLNYWGDTDDSGPSTVGLGTGVPVSAGVIYCPWLDDAPPFGVAVGSHMAAITISESSGDADDDGIICPGATVLIDATDAFAASYLWSPGGQTTASISVTPAVTTEYSVTVTYPGGCTDVDSVTITVNTSCASTMSWVYLPPGSSTGSCTSGSNCCDNILCYGLQYTPGETGILQDYTTGFLINCIDGNDPIVNNASCVMVDNSFDINGCSQNMMVLFNSSGNNGAIPVMQGVPLILHQVCFSIPGGDSVTINEDVNTNLTTSILVDDTLVIPELPAFTPVTIMRTTPTDPPDGAATVSCPGLAVEPDYPVVLEQCGDTIPATLISTVDDPSELTCEGTRTYTFTYTDCAGYDFDWVFVYTITRNDFTITTPNGSGTVSCPALATSGAVTLPTVISDCLEPLAPGAPVQNQFNTDTYNGCEGTISYTWTYTDCAGHTHLWTYTYNVDYTGGLTPPTNGSATVSCPALAGDPGAPPSILDACGRTVVPVLIGSTTPPACEGTVIWTYRYTACDNTTADWTFTYTIDYNGGLILPANGNATVSCPGQAVNPGAPPSIMDACNRTVVPVLIGSTTPPACEGTVIWTYRYTACDNTTADWTFTYTIDYSGGLTPPSNSSATVSCPNLAVNPGAPPSIMDACNRTVVPVLIGSTTPPDCEGTVVWTYRYTACDFSTADWTFTYTIDYSGGLTPPADVTVTVACPVQAVDPGAPASITDACGRTVAPVLIGSTSPPACEGAVVWTYRYTACDNTTTADWTYTYDVEHTPPVEVGGPAETSSTINCYLDAVAPALPVMNDACGMEIVPTGPVIGGTNTGGCGGTITYTYTYTDCDGVDYPWVYTYTVDCDPVVLKVWLEGPYDPMSNSMHTTLNSTHCLPGQNAPPFYIDYPAGQPYNIAPWNYSGNPGTQWGDYSGQTPYPPDVVDWVLVTVRKDGMLPANNIWTCAGWVLQNGDVVFPENCPMPALSTDTMYYFVVQQRNHLGILSPSDVDMPCGTAVLQWDFRGSNSYQPIFRFGQKEVEPGVWAMFGANGEQISSITAINSLDRALWRNMQGVFGYSLGDFNLSTHAGSEDEDIWKSNQNRTTGVVFY